MKILITDRILRGLKPAPAGKRTVIWDTAVPGLCVRVTDKGATSFNVMRRLKGASGPPLRRALGLSWHVPFPSGHPLPYSLAEAREDARVMILDMARGIDPKAREKERQEARKREEAAKKAEEVRKQTHSFAAVAETFIAKHVASLRTARDVEGTIRRELFPALGEKQLASITQDDIVALIDDVVESGRPYVARHVLAYLSKFFVWAIAKRRYGVTVSPCAGVKAKDIVGELKPRQRVLSDSELAALWTVTAGLDYPSGPFVRLLTLTGQRLREVAEMRWSEIDIEKRIWMVPGERMKADATQIVPLSPAVIEILKSLPRWTGDYVFSTTGGDRPISGFSKMKLRIDAHMPDTPNWRFHDLRRSMRTGLSALRVPNVVSELCIGHTQKDLHKVYDQHAYFDEKRHALDAWANRLLSIVGPDEACNVVAIAARR
jgi:integrase